MSRDYATRTTDVELMSESIDRAERWLELKEAARVLLKHPESPTCRQRLLEAIEELETPR